jgi:Flp pilus assembly pilin Flp
VIRWWGASSREDGQGLAEYTFLMMLIAVVCVGVLTQLGLTIIPWFGGLAPAF